MTFGRSSFLRRRSSSLSFAAPRAVRGTLLKPTPPRASPADDSRPRYRDGRAHRKWLSRPRPSCSTSPCSARPRRESSAIRLIACLPSVVFTIRLSSRFLIMSTTCGRPSRTLLTRWHGTPPSCERLRGAARSRRSRSRASTSILPSSTAPGLSRSRTLMNASPRARQHDARRDLRLGVRLAERPSRAHDLARRFHLGAQDRVCIRELDEREHGLLDGEVRPPAGDA